MLADEDNEKEELSIHDILADFFLKKIDMPNSKKQDFEKKRKKSKHKSKRKKHKKYKSSCEDRDSDSNMNKIEIRSNSEEKDIIRLKKIKKLETKDSNLGVSCVTNFPFAQEQTDVEHLKSNRPEIQIPESACDEKYGPSLELLLSGAKTNDQFNLTPDDSMVSGSIQLLKTNEDNASLKELSCRSSDLDALKNIICIEEKNGSKNSKNIDLSEKNILPDKILKPSCSVEPLFEKSANSVESNTSQLSLSTIISKESSFDNDSNLKSQKPKSESLIAGDQLSLSVNDSVNEEIQKVKKTTGSSSKDSGKNKRKYRSRSISRVSRSRSRSKNNVSPSLKSRSRHSSSRTRSPSHCSGKEYRKRNSSQKGSYSKTHSKTRSISPKSHSKRRDSYKHSPSRSRYSKSRTRGIRKSSGSSRDRSYSRSHSRDRKSRRDYYSRSKHSSSSKSYESKKYSVPRSRHSHSRSRSRRYSSDSRARSHTPKRKSFSKSRSSSSRSKSKDVSNSKNRSSNKDSSRHQSNKRKSFSRSRSSSSCSKSKDSPNSKKRNGKDSSRHKSRKRKSKSRSRSKSKSSISSKFKPLSESTDKVALKNSESKSNNEEKTCQSKLRNSCSPLKSEKNSARSKTKSPENQEMKKNDDGKEKKSSSPLKTKSTTDEKKSSRHKSSHSEKRNDEKHKSEKRSQSKSRHSHSPHETKKGEKRKRYKIDQAKILEIARKNVLSMIEKGTLPEGLPMENLKKEQLVSLKSGGKSVQELTDFCLKLSNEENNPVKEPIKDEKEDSEADSNFIHHPFKLKEQSVIKLNIKNAIQIPTKTHAEKVAETARLSSQFPVSSGNQHRQKELEWIPVEPTKPPVKKAESKVVPQQEATVQQITVPQTIIPPVEPQTTVVHEIALPPEINSKPPEPVVPTSNSHLGFYPSPVSNTHLSIMTPPPPPPPNLLSYPLPVFPQQQEVTSFNNLMPSALPSQAVMSFQTVIPEPPKIPRQTPFKAKPIDIAAIVSNRFKALTKLQTNPNDQEALNALTEAHQNIQEWVESQQVPGMFTGSTDAKLLSVRELCGPRHFHIKKDLFTCAAPVMEGKGMSLLKKMGWNPGEGLGKNKEGQLEPLMPDIKTDKRGLVSEGEGAKKSVAASLMKELEGKHPVSALMELCSKRKWKPPLYTVVKDSGPPHKKQFLFKVEVNDVEYQPVTPSSNKKDAKADAAVICLQSLNVFSK